MIHMVIAVLCEGLRPEAHPLMADIVHAIGPDTNHVALARRVIHNYDVTVTAEDFANRLVSYMDEYLEKLAYVFRDSDDPQVEALVAVSGYFIINNSDILKPVVRLPNNVVRFPT